jgi:hypothetical protein
MKPAAAFLSVFVVVLLISALIAWVGGFNFDQRDPEVAHWLLGSIWFAGMFGGLGVLIADRS